LTLWSAEAVRSEMDCDPPLVLTVMEPETLPLNASRRLLPEPEPETEPARPYVRSSQLPDTRPPLAVRLARSSTRPDGLAQRSESPRPEPPLLDT
jgi:hypothetical protein